MKEYSLYAIFCLNEHWLHPYVFKDLFPDYCFSYECDDDPKDSTFPGLVKGKGGVATLWHSSLNRSVTLISSRFERTIGIN